MWFMNRKYKMIILILLLFSNALFGSPVNRAELNKHLDASGFSGVIYVSRGNKVLIKKAMGYRSLETKKPIKISDQFQIGSNTKQFTAAAILRLQENGVLSLNDRVTKYLPHYPLFNEIKIRDLLNHTSGVVNYTSHKKFMKSRSYERTLSLDDIIKHCAQYPLDFSPGSKWKYSNGGYIIAGKIIEVVSGESWNSFIKNNFLIPLNMKNTDHKIYFEEVSPVRGHVGSSVVKNLNLSWALSAGSLHSTIEDMAKWFNIYDSSRLLTKESQKEMTTPYLNNYALGIFVYPYGKDSIISHTGITRGFYSKTYYVRKSKLKIITMDNNHGKRSEIPELLLKYFLVHKD
jgi:CubicO group peptidase (beta-lactamase class C family)